MDFGQNPASFPEPALLDPLQAVSDINVALLDQMPNRLAPVGQAIQITRTIARNSTYWLCRRTMDNHHLYA